MEEEFYKKVSDNYQGNWINTDNEEVVKLFIGEDEVTVIKELNGEESLNISFPGNCHWFGNYLCFTAESGRVYNITYADINSLIFGEQADTRLGNYKWRKKFTRV